MTRRSYRWLSAGLLTSGCAGLMGLTSMFNAAFAFGDDNTALIMGFAGEPNPGPSYLNEVTQLFLDPSNSFPGQTVFPGYTPTLQLVPLNNNYGQGLDEGAAQLNQGILQHLEDGKVVVFGYSESASIATQEMINLGNLPADQRPDPADLQFVLVESMNNPNGGYFERFPFIPGMSLPATPVDTLYPTDVYSIEYSEMSDFPKYPLNFFATANAIAGYVYLHPFLIPGWPTTFDPTELANAVKEPVSSELGNTTYWMIPTQNLPLLEGLRDTPFFGPAMADLIQPDLRVLVDLGYDRTDPADVVTSAQLFSPNIDWTTVDNNLALGAQQGWIAAQVDLGLLPKSALPDLYPYLPDLSGLFSGTTDTGLQPASGAAELPGLSTLAGDLGEHLSGSTFISDLFTNPLSLFGL